MGMTEELTQREVSGAETLAARLLEAARRLHSATDENGLGQAAFDVFSVVVGAPPETIRVTHEGGVSRRFGAEERPEHDENLLARATHDGLPARRRTSRPRARGARAGGRTRGRRRVRRSCGPRESLRGRIRAAQGDRRSPRDREHGAGEAGDRARGGCRGRGAGGVALGISLHRDRLQQLRDGQQRRRGAPAGRRLHDRERRARPRRPAPTRGAGTQGRRRELSALRYTRSWWSLQTTRSRGWTRRHACPTATRVSAPIA